MVKEIFLIAFLILTNISCQTKSGSINTGNEIPKEQQHIVDKKKEFSQLYRKAPNSIQKNEVQSQFDSWLTSYFKDTLNGNIQNFSVKVQNVSSGQFQNAFYYIIADFITEDGIRFYEEQDFKTEKQMKKHPLLNKVLNVKENGTAKLSAKFEKLGDFNAIESSSSLRYRTVSISVDTVINIFDQ